MAYKAPVDEKQLIADLQNPSTAAQAFDTLMRAYGEQVYWQIRKMVVSHDDANDLLQNCFIKTWKNIHNFRGDARLSTWLYKIAVNESISSTRSVSVRASPKTATTLSCFRTSRATSISTATSCSSSCSAP